MTLKSGNCQAAETLEQPLRSKNKRWLASLVDTIQCGRKLWIQHQKYQNLLLTHNSMHCTINDGAVLLCFLCGDVLKLVLGNSGLTILWQKIIKNVYKCKNITEAKYKNNKIQKYTYEMFCGLSELTQVWPSSDKKLSKWYRYKNITEAEYKNNTIQKYNYEMFCGWSELTQVWPPGDSSDQAASQPRRQKYQIICLTQNSNSSIS